MKTPAILMVIMLGLFACQQEKLPEDRLEDAEIYFFGKQDGESLLMIAGEDSLYNYTSLYENEHNIYELSSSLAHLKAPDEKRYLEVIIWDSHSTESSISNEDRFENGERDLMIQSDYIQNRHFRMVPNFNEVGVGHYNWNLGTYGTSFELHPEPVLKPKGSEWICLNGVSIEGDSLSTCKKVSMTTPELYSPGLRIYEITEEFVILLADMKGVSPDQWFWNGEMSDDGIYAISRDEIVDGQVHNVKIMNKGQFLFDTDFMLDTTNGRISLKYINFSAMHSDIAYKDITQTGKVVVNYFIPGKGLFSSRFLDDQSNTRFHIKENTFFRQNEEGISTRKLNYRFDLPLITEMGDTIQLNTTGSIMAFPNP